MIRVELHADETCPVHLLKGLLEFFRQLPCQVVDLAHLSITARKADSNADVVAFLNVVQGTLGHICQDEGGSRKDLHKRLRLSYHAAFADLERADDAIDWRPEDPVSIQLGQSADRALTGIDRSP